SKPSSCPVSARSNTRATAGSMLVNRRSSLRDSFQWMASRTLISVFPGERVFDLQSDVNRTRIIYLTPNLDMPWMISRTEIFLSEQTVKPCAQFLICYRLGLAKHR